MSPAALGFAGEETGGGTGKALAFVCHLNAHKKASLHFKYICSLVLVRPENAYTDMRSLAR